MRKLIAVTLCVAVLGLAQAEEKKPAPAASAEKKPSAPVEEKQPAEAKSEDAQSKVDKGWKRHLEQRRQARKEAQQSEAKPYLYRGTPRSQTWFDKRYEQFRDKIAIINGEYVQMDPRVYWELDQNWSGVVMVRVTRKSRVPGPIQVLKSPPTATTAIRTMPPNAKVFQIIDKASVLISMNVDRSRYGFGQVIFLVRNVNTSKLVDGSGVGSMTLLYSGTFQYTTALGTTKTIQSYVPYIPLNMEHFAKALPGGLVLYRYKWVKYRKRTPKGAKKKWADAFKIVRKSVK